MIRPDGVQVYCYPPEDSKPGEVMFFHNEGNEFTPPPSVGSILVLWEIPHPVRETQVWPDLYGGLIGWRSKVSVIGGGESWVCYEDASLRKPGEESAPLKYIPLDEYKRRKK